VGFNDVVVKIPSEEEINQRSMKLSEIVGRSHEEVS